MIPLAVGTGPGAEERRSVAVVVIGGQSLCLLLTLIMTPVAYSVFDDIGAAAWFRLKRLWRRKTSTAMVPGPEEGELEVGAKSSD
jgi:HAE1 family hydrophobic/amphiphilic exporter-1